MPGIAETQVELARPFEAVGSNVFTLAAKLRPGAKNLISDTTVLRISNALQSSLHVQDVIHAFTNEITRVVHHTTVHYKNAAVKINISEGQQSHNRCSYELNLLGNSLGEIEFYNAEPFSDDDQMLLEVMLCALIYPLRNALLYERALTIALRDPLTGLNNRGSFDASLKQQVSIAHRHGNPLSVVMLDVDLFKSTNDSYGHLVGDEVLCSVADAIVKCTRDSDIVFRYGGEEFVVILNNTESPGAAMLAERIRLCVENTEVSPDHSRLRVTISAGVACYRTGDDPLQLLGRADEMLYRAKSRGRNRIAAPEN